MTAKKQEKFNESTEEQNVTASEVLEDNQEESAQEPANEANELTALQEKCDDLADKNLRLMAEFDNYRKRTIKERSELIKTANENVLVDMLSLIDDFERAKEAVETSEDVTALREGIDLIYNKFVNFLSQKGVKAIETESADFNVEFHEAITTFPAPTEEQIGKIIDCVSKGYTLNEKVIRFSKVVVGE